MLMAVGFVRGARATMFHTWADDSMGSNQEQPALRPTHPHPPLAVSMGEKLKPAGPQLAIEGTQ
ncbi:predicted protein [Plenodomus lingam JN3]|uniref:Predicted protein n=1 Tax=Leptosphaeria maculans (strain JN3 / isolate v23.1.3 / race Av1-4-5-6-7-8) TaxID=985895 RepID=E4ZH42_LEPMJ|nr:predicted protein [Plenodomus lingam JN3]CBX90612.1 predicted protein [Plenodomus lingam JN3]